MTNNIEEHEPDADLGCEYANLVLAEEYGVDSYGDTRNPNPQRRKEIEVIAERDGWDLVLPQFVNNFLEELEEIENLEELRERKELARQARLRI